MAFFKQTGDTLPKNLASIHTAAWTLIYGGLLSAITGYTAAQSDANLGYKICAAGSLATAVGVLLIYLRSRMPDK